MITPEQLQTNARAGAGVTNNETLRSVLRFFAQGLNPSEEGKVEGSEILFGANEPLARATLNSLGISTSHGEWYGTNVYEKHEYSSTSYLGGALTAMSAEHPLTGLKALGINAYMLTNDRGNKIVAKRPHEHTYPRTSMGYVVTTTGMNEEGTLAVEFSLEMPITRNATNYGRLAMAVFDPKEVNLLRDRMKSSEIVAQVVPAAREQLGALVTPMFTIRVGELGRGGGLLGWPTIRQTYRSASVLRDGSLRQHRQDTVPIKSK